MDAGPWSWSTYNQSLVTPTNRFSKTASLFSPDTSCATVCSSLKTILEVSLARFLASNSPFLAASSCKYSPSYGRSTDEALRLFPIEAKRRATSRDSNTDSRRSVDLRPALAIFAAETRYWLKFDTRRPGLVVKELMLWRHKLERLAYTHDALVHVA